MTTVTAVAGPGLAALPEGGRVDFDAIRADRRRRLRTAMAAAELDVLILGRPADVAFAAGARSLFTTGSRPYAAGCVMLADGDRLHLVADHDEGVPAEVPRERLIGRSWNPAIAARRVAEIPGLADAKRIGTAGTSPAVASLLASAAPDAEVVDARGLVRAVRTRKSPAEVATIETACAVAEAGLAAMQDELRPGVTTRQLVAVYAERLGQLGVTVIPDGFVAGRAALGVSAGFDDNPLVDGELVDLSPSISYGGYDGTLARTVVAGASVPDAVAQLRRRTLAAVGAVVEACVTGARGADLVAAWTGAGEQEFRAPIAHGLGMGLEEPIVGMGLGAEETLVGGMVLAVQGWVGETGVGGWHHREVVQVTGGAPRVLTRAAGGLA